MVTRSKALGRCARGMTQTCVTLALAMASSGTARAQMPGMPEHMEMMSWGRTLFVLVDQLEYSPAGRGRPLNVETRAWYGGAYNRVWLRAQSEQATTSRQGEAEIELLYGRLVDPFWDAVVGVRVDRHWGDEDPGRVLFGVGFLGLAPFRFELEPTIFVSPRGEIAARLQAGYQVLITQRLVAEPEFEVNAAIQRVPRFGVARGINDFETGVRVRYEFRREFAPYVGWSMSRRVGGSTNIAREHGEPVAENRFVAGLRMWR